MTTTLDHIDALRDVVTEIAQDCLLLDLTPCTVSVSKHGALLTAAVHFANQDTKAVDDLADSYQLPGLVEGHPNYTRRGRFDLDGRRVDVEVFCGLPKHPSLPADCAPQAVEA